MTGRHPVLPVLLALLVIAAIASPAAAATSVTLIPLDGPDEGLNDPTPITAAGGNTGQTLGEARRAALEFAVAIWAEQLSSDVVVRIEVSFDPLGGTATAATLGRGGPTAVYRDFAGAPRPGTWYPSALADRLAGVDLGPGENDVALVFNSDVDGATVFGSSRFYYGFDAAGNANDVDFIATALHEIAHGLGFGSQLDAATGAKLAGYDDAYLLHLEHHGAVPPDLVSMTDGERLAALGAEPDLHWTGPAAVAIAGSLAAGTTAEGHVVLEAPTPVTSANGDHFAALLEPDQFMELFYTGGTTRFELTRAVLEDLGWGAAAACGSEVLP